MRIIHYIDTVKDNDLLSDHLRHLTTAEQDYAKVTTTSRTDDFRKIIKQENPDIVHIHACWNYQASLRTQWAARSGCAVVLSPHWGLDDRIRSHEQQATKFMKSLLYQYKTVHKVDAMLVTSEKERQTLLRLGWKKRIDVVPSSITDSSYSDTIMAQMTIGFYKKVLDTRYQFAMTEMEKLAIPSLLHTGLTQESTHNIMPSDQLLNLRSLNPEQWRRILLYADDEGIRDIIDRSIELIQLNVPNIVTADISRYKPMAPKEEQTLERKELISKSPISRQRLIDNTHPEETVIRQIATMLFNIRLIQRKGRLSLRHLADLYTVIRYNDYDEDRLQEVLHHMRISHFSRRIIQLLADKMHLEEGFMPISPLNDRGTRSITRQNFAQRQ
ncbi:MAG: glycosyltransferase [Prevotella sp.]|nr:glycosyltransferase [Prevotella sp.]